MPIFLFDEKDTPGDLLAVLDMYSEQIWDLMSERWYQKSSRVFLFGDYEFQRNNSGLSGPSGARPCLHCHNMKKSFDKEPNKRPLDEQAPRTLQTLQTDHQRCVDAGSRLSQAKLFNNAVLPLSLPIEIVNAVIPALHLDLGIFAWLFDHMEKELQQLDFQVAVHYAPSNEDDDRFTRLSTLQSARLRAGVNGYSKPIAILCILEGAA